MFVEKNIFLLFSYFAGKKCHNLALVCSSQYTDVWILWKGLTKSLRCGENIRYKSLFFKLALTVANCGQQGLPINAFLG